MNKLFNEEHQKLVEKYNPDNSALREHQLKMLEMLKYVDSICKNNNISYWLSYGTLLGAVRHGGFIPWDDDLDISMCRADYMRLRRILLKESEYAFQDHSTDSHYFYEYGKLRDLNSYIEERPGLYQADKYWKYKGCFIDIVPVEVMPLFFKKITIQTKERGARWFRGTNNFILHGLGEIQYYLNHIFLFPFLRICLKGVCYKGNLLFNAMGEGTLGSGAIDVIFPLSSVEFEGTLFPAPNNVDLYLRKEYGDYMKLPPIEERISHQK